jgi:Uma2 family endonuclease
MTTSARGATIDDLYRVEGKAEIVNGEIVVMSPTGGLPNLAAGLIYASLLDHQRRVGGGLAYTDGVGFIVDLPNRRSFSPDVAFHRGPRPTMKFVDGAPVFAVEVRSEDDYGPAAERRMSAKRADYLAAGTLVVWDVDLVGPETIRAYRSADSEPVIFRRGDVADAEPALPGWRFRTDDLFF